jgi:malate dehydrogenase (oxaloacetate-decarboxylating)(NADP+)
MRCFNDDIQGTGAVIAAGFITAVKVTGVPHSMQKIVFHGAGSAGIGVADQIVQVMLAADHTLTPEQCRARFYFVDSKGLVTSTRPGTLEKHKIAYARGDMKEIATLIDVIREIKPTALIGLSGQGGAFDKDILELMGKNWPKPIIFALSNPTKNAECTAEAAYRATDGRCVYASGSPFAPVEMDDGRLLYPGQGNNMYIFPGLGFGAWLCQATEVSDEMIIAAATALAEFVTPADISLGRIYPALDTIREISVGIASRVMDVAFSQKLAKIERPSDLRAFVKEHMYNPTY